MYNSYTFPIPFLWNCCYYNGNNSIILIIAFICDRNSGIVNSMFSLLWKHQIVYSATQYQRHSHAMHFRTKSLAGALWGTGTFAFQPSWVLRRRSLRNCGRLGVIRNKEKELVYINLPVEQASKCWGLQSAVFLLQFGVLPYKIWGVQHQLYLVV